jgi:hypothetical protein
MRGLPQGFVIGSTFDLSINGTHADGNSVHLIQTQ